MKCAPVTSGYVPQHQDCGPILRQGADDAVWALNPCSGAAAHRFERIVQDLPSHLAHIPPTVGFLLCAIAYDCVLAEGDLIAMAQATSSAVPPTVGSRVSWTSTREGYVHLDARCLSVRSRLIARRLPPQVDWPATLTELRGFLRKNYPDVDNTDGAQVLPKVLIDARTWWYLHLPLCLFSHVQGAVRMPILDEAVLRRLESETAQLAFQHTPSDETLGAAHDHALDELLDIPSKDQLAHPKHTICQIQSIFSIGTNLAGLRLATYLNARELRDKLTLAIDLMRSEGWVASVLLSWAVHLLNVGSVRKANPAISTLAAYVNILLEPLATTLRQLKYPPALYSQDDWVKLFEELRQHTTSGQHAAALASLHHWAVRTYGCDPMPDVMFQTVEATRVHTNLIWPHEQQRALELAATVSPDERVCRQVQVMLALGSGGLFRVGDLPGLTTKDLQEAGSGLRVHLNPGRGIHGGKSRASRRIVRLHDPALIGLINQWRVRRNLESGLGPNEALLLFGDPHTPRKLYRVGHCIRLVNDILRRATGDDSVSFHSLRHAGATARAYTLLTQAQSLSAVSPLDELCHEMGHATRQTLWSTYFHLPEFALRKASDLIPAIAALSAEEAAFWLALTPAALRQRACRAASESVQTADLYLQWVQQLADGASPTLRRPGECRAFQQPAATPPLTNASKDLHWVRQALAVIAQGSTSEAACMLLSCAPEDLRLLCLAIQLALGSLTTVGRNQSSPLLLASADTDHALAWARQQITRQHLAFDLGSNALLHVLAIFLEQNAHTPTCAEAALAWTKMRRRNVLSMHDPVATQAMLHLLRQASFPGDALVVRIQSETDSSNEGLLRTESSMREIRASVQLGVGASVRIERVRPRRGQPDLYLVVGRSRMTPGISAPSASLRMCEFHGLLFSLCVYQSMTKGISQP